MSWITLLITIVWCVLVPLYFISLKWKHKKFFEALDKIPGPPTYPLIGSIKHIGIPPEKIVATLNQFFKEYGSIFRIITYTFGVVMIYKPQHIEVILSNSEEIKKASSYNFLRPWLGDGLLTSTGSKWHSRRKLFTPTFHFKILESFVITFNEKSQILVEKLRKIQPGTEMDLFNHITLCTLDIICETAMGINMNTQSDEQSNNSHSEYIKSIYRLSTAMVKRTLRPWLFPDWSFYYLSSIGKQYSNALKVLHSHTNKVVAEKIASKKRDKEKNQKHTEQEDDVGIKKKQAFLDLLLDASEAEHNQLSVDEIREQVDTFMFEGHDTTTSAVSWCLLALGNHQDTQEKVAEELQNIMGSEKRNITLNDVKEMKYLEMVIKEALRLYPSVPFVGRKLYKDLKIGDYLLPADSEVRLSIGSCHRDPEHFPNPNVFNPDNFLPEIVKDRHPYAYVPFSAGPRNCIGQKFALTEEKILLASILLNFRIESVEKLEDIACIPELILRPKSGLRLKLYPRSKKM